MRLTILGATGHVGRELVSQALEASHDVTVLVRDRERLGDVAQTVTVVQGDSTDPAAVAQAIDGADAVISVLGHSKGSTSDVLAKSAAVLVDAMRSAGPNRVVVLSNPAVHEPDDGKESLGARAAGALAGLGAMGHDHVDQARIITESGLDWTVVRSALMSSGEATGKSVVGPYAPEHTLARGDLAAFLLRCATEGEYSGQTPFVSGSH